MEDDLPTQSLARLNQELAPELEVLRPIGKGRMADVYLARQVSLDRPVAVKVLSTRIADDAMARARFEREARAAGALDSPYAVEVHRFGYLSDGLPFLVMQYVRGGTMEDRIAAEGSLPQAEARRILADVSAALAAAHEQGFIHRDVRAGNVLCDREKERALLSDFGLAGLQPGHEARDARITRTGEIIGTPGYMAPEQLEGKPATEATDIFCVGLLGYEILTGQGPFAARTQWETLRRSLKDPPTPLRLLRPEVDPELAALLERCLAKDPQKRPSASFLAKALRGEVAMGSSPPTQGVNADQDVLEAILKRRIPKIVLSTTGVLLGVLAISDMVVESLNLGPEAFELALDSFVCGIAASGVLAWFHGARGRQRVQPLEIVLLVGLGVIWVGVGVWILLR